MEDLKRFLKNVNLECCHSQMKILAMKKVAINLIINFSILNLKISDNGVNFFWT